MANTPTTEEVRDAYCIGENGDAWPSLGVLRRDIGPEFDDWLATHDAQVRADERRRCVEAIGALPVTWVEGWDSVTLPDVLRVVSGLGGGEVEDRG